MCRADQHESRVVTCSITNWLQGQDTCYHQAETLTLRGSNKQRACFDSLQRNWPSEEIVILKDKKNLGYRGLMLW